MASQGILLSTYLPLHHCPAFCDKRHLQFECSALIPPPRQSFRHLFLQYDTRRSFLWLRTLRGVALIVRAALDCSTSKRSMARFIGLLWACPQPWCQVGCVVLGLRLARVLADRIGGSLHSLLQIQRGVPGPVCYIWPYLQYMGKT